MGSRKWRERVATVLLDATSSHSVVLICFEQRIFQHEYDHLDGVVYIDRLSEEGKKEVQPTIDKLIADFGEGGKL